MAAQSAAEEVAFDQKRVLNRLDVLSRKAEECGQISAAVRCEELIGKQRGMFVDRTLSWSGRISEMTPEQLKEMEAELLELHPQLALEGKTVVETTAELVDTQST